MKAVQTEKQKNSSLGDSSSSKTSQPVYSFWTHFWFKCEHSKEKWNERIIYIKTFLANINIKL